MVTTIRTLLGADEAHRSTELAAGGDIREFGSKVSGFVKAEHGPFKCGTCLHESNDACNHPVVMADPAVEKNTHGDAIVSDDDCCRYWTPR